MKRQNAIKKLVKKYKVFLLYGWSSHRRLLGYIAKSALIVCDCDAVPRTLDVPANRCAVISKEERLKTTYNFTRVVRAVSALLVVKRYWSGRKIKFVPQVAKPARSEAALHTKIAAAASEPLPVGAATTRNVGCDVLSGDNYLSTSIIEKTKTKAL